MSLDGQKISGWWGIEMALHGGEFGDPAVFTDDRAPFLQFHRVGATLDATTPIEIGTYQNNMEFGLLIRSPTRPVDQASEEEASAAEGIYRYRQPTELPVGTIADVVVKLSVSGDISSVSLAVAGAPLLVVAGEVEEQWSGRLDFVLDDESVLVFTDPTAAETVPWRNPSSITSPRTYDRSTHIQRLVSRSVCRPTGEQIDWYTSPEPDIVRRVFGGDAVWGG